MTVSTERIGQQSEDRRNALRVGCARVPLIAAYMPTGKTVLQRRASQCQPRSPDAAPMAPTPAPRKLR